MGEGHIDHIIRLAVEMGKSPITAIQMATIQAAQRFGLPFVGAIAPGYRADVLVLGDLDRVDVEDVYAAGRKVVSRKAVVAIEPPAVDGELERAARNSFHLDELTAEDFHIEEKSARCRVIELIPGQILTKEAICEMDWSRGNGVDEERDILKLAVIERHKNTGHRGLGFVRGFGIRKGAIASSVSHDSHNIIVVGSDDRDMAAAANHIRQKGGSVVVSEGKILSEMALPVAGLMTDRSGEEIARANEAVREAVRRLGVPEGIEPFMNMAFVSLPVIPSLKMATQGLVDVERQERVSVYAD
jgi:adenine deaminase